MQLALSVLLHFTSASQRDTATLACAALALLLEAAKPSPDWVLKAIPQLGSALQQPGFADGLQASHPHTLCNIAMTLPRFTADLDPDGAAAAALLPALPHWLACITSHNPQEDAAQLANDIRKLQSEDDRQSYILEHQMVADFVHSATVLPQPKMLLAANADLAAELMTGMLSLAHALADMLIVLQDAPIADARTEAAPESESEAGAVASIHAHVSSSATAMVCHGLVTALGAAARLAHIDGGFDMSQQQLAEVRTLSLKLVHQLVAAPCGQVRLWAHANDHGRELWAVSIHRAIASRRGDKAYACMVPCLTPWSAVFQPDCCESTCAHAEPVLIVGLASLKP